MMNNENNNNKKKTITITTVGITLKSCLQEKLTRRCPQEATYGCTTRCRRTSSKGLKKSVFVLWSTHINAPTMCLLNISFVLCLFVCLFVPVLCVLCCLHVSKNEIFFFLTFRIFFKIISKF